MTRHDTAPSPHDVLRGIVREIDSSDDRITSENKHKSEIYKKAKADGFNIKALRKVIAARRLDSSEREQNDADFELYWNAVHGLVNARVEIIDEIPPALPAADRATEATPPASVATQSHAVDAAHGVDGGAASLAGAEGDQTGTPIQTGGHTLDKGEGAPSGVLPDQLNSATTADPAGSDLTPAASRPNSSPMPGADTGETVSTPVSPVAIAITAGGVSIEHHGKVA